MPVRTVCPDHPDSEVTYPADLSEHVRTDHPGENIQAVSDRCHTTVTTQAEAHGRDSIRIVHCRACGTPTTYRLAANAEPPVVSEYCEEHDGER